MGNESFITKYEKELQWFRNYIIKHEHDTSRRVSDYVSYLKRWFSDDYETDGVTFSQKYEWRILPMPFNIYWG